ncbi:MAG TPA: TrkA family potassium uptake protein [Thermotogota bacterium]|nr:TrkA family potassium uptake protein [Thermotogota bacterium]NLZ13184.1 TrkA family potassium uptake protein [Thermotogaceae bacterium]MDD8054063.1 TrkA family potassium uptake protein [Thermotogota bacterium]HNR62725.1 TrkA family potassium uptake protein [Thermotogota bacterium]HNT94731.1 TrkA family potassium uptake protein [Thermotogota bacterium]
MSKRKSWYVIVIGSGRFGARLAGKLSYEDHSVVVIDTNETNFDNLPPEYTGFTIQGDATDVEVLKLAKAHKADLFLALTDDDNTNFFVSQVAKDIFHVPHVISRVYDPANLPLFHEFKIETITPVLLALSTANKMLEKIAEEDK